MSYLRVRLDSVTQGCHAITHVMSRASHSRRGTQVRDSRQEGYKTTPSKLGQSVASQLLYPRASFSGHDQLRSRTSMHTTTTSGHDLEDFQECRSVVCMIDRVCCVVYRCNYELLISPYNLFHPTTNTLLPEQFAQVMGCSHRL